MNITVINGSMRHGSTWHLKESVLQAMAQKTEISVQEFDLPEALPHFCNGCFSCFLNGEQTCPHAASVQPIVEAMLASDLIVLTSPVYGLDVSGQMKACLDHLCYLWMSHRPQAAMFHKLGLAISTSAGIGMVRTAKTMQLSLKYWGLPKTFTMAQSVAAMRWEGIAAPKRAKLEKCAQKTANAILRAAEKGDRLHMPIQRSLVFRMMAGAQKKNDWNPADRNHWESQGWLSGKRPF